MLDIECYPTIHRVQEAMKALENQLKELKH